MDLETAADELYALEPGEFVARRNELVAQARAGGEREVAKQVGALARPTVAAWLVNRLVEGSGEMEELFSLGEEMRATQAALDGQRLKELTAHRHRLVAALVKRSTSGSAVSESARREVEATLVAAVADAGAADAVASGRLTRALSYSGFGEVDLDAAIAVRPNEARRARGRETPPPAPVDLAAHREAKERRAATARRDADPDRDKDAQRQQAAERAAASRLDAARAAMGAADEAVERSQRNREAAKASTKELTEEASRLQRELSDVRRRLAAATRDAERAERSVRRLHAKLVLRRVT